MKTISLALHIPAADALARGSASYGDVDLPLTAADVAIIPPEVRARLVPLAGQGAYGVGVGPDSSYSYRHVARLDVPEPSVPAFLARLAEVDAESAATAAKLAAEREGRILAALALPDEKWVGRGGFWRGNTRYSRPCVSVPLLDADQDDPRVKARVAAVEAGLLADLLAASDRKIADAEKAEQERERERKIAAEQKKAAEAACRVALRTLAAPIPTFARAAVEGYPVERQVLDHLAEQLQDEVDSAAFDSVVSSKLCDLDRLDVRAAPSPEAFALLDAAKAAVEHANSALPAAVGRWALSKIVRVEGEQDHPVTCVVARLETPIGDREILWSTESLDVEPSSDD
jgi:hypothetical protein